MGALSLSTASKVRRSVGGLSRLLMLPLNLR